MASSKKGPGDNGTAAIALIAAIVLVILVFCFANNIFIVRL